MSVITEYLEKCRNEQIIVVVKTQPNNHSLGIGRVVEYDDSHLVFALGTGSMTDNQVVIVLDAITSIEPAF